MSFEENLVYAALTQETRTIESHLLLGRQWSLKFPVRRFHSEVGESETGVEVEFYSSKFIRCVTLTVPSAHAELPDNYFDLIPGIKRKLTIRCDRQLRRRIANTLVVK